MFVEYTASCSDLLCSTWTGAREREREREELRYGVKVRENERYVNVRLKITINQQHINWCRGVLKKTHRTGVELFDKFQSSKTDKYLLWRQSIITQTHTREHT